MHRPSLHAIMFVVELAKTGIELYLQWRKNLAPQRISNVAYHLALVSSWEDNSFKKSHPDAVQASVFLATLLERGEHSLHAKILGECQAKQKESPAATVVIYDIAIS